MTIHLVDEDGKPVQGATVTLDCLRTAQSPGSSFGLPHPLVSPVSDADGVVTVTYPKYVMEKLETVWIGFEVDHPNYCPYESQNYAVTGGEKPIVLKKGATLTVSGYLDKPEDLLPKVSPQITDSNNLGFGRESWNVNANGSSTTHQLGAGPYSLRVIHFGKDGSIYFSDIVHINIEKGRAETVNLKLKKGIRVEGKLDASVPRPVTNGRVVATIGLEGQPVWMTWRPVASDGSFVFGSLPEGMLNVIALCDGFVSKNPTNIDDRHKRLRNPQSFALDGSITHAEVTMEPTATCEVLVTDQHGNPIKGAQIMFFPNEEFAFGTNLVGNRSFRSEEYLTMNKDEYRKLMEARQSELIDFQATTDAHGIATVRNLPGAKQNFAIVHPTFELPARLVFAKEWRRDREIELMPRETKKLTVQLEPKGARLLGDEGDMLERLDAAFEKWLNP